MYTFLAIIGLIWLVIIFTDTIFKSCMVHPYFRALYTAGLEIQPLLIVWTTNRYNRFINRMGLYKPEFVKKWFRFGAFITCVILLPCFYLYIYKVVSLFYTDSKEEFESSNIVPVVPGFNFPLSQWRLYLCIILVCTIVHEFGHALAASRLGVPVDGFGLAVYIVAPFAFVNVRLEQLKQSSLWEQMTVFCAGIWHNIVLSLSCLFILKYFLLFIAPLYYVGGGVIVVHVNEDSALNEPVYGFEIGDHIYAMGDCTVKDLDSWYECLNKVENKGLCVPRPKLDDNPVRARKCSKIPGHLYFQRQGTLLDLVFKIGLCLPARSAVQNYSVCTTDSDCETSSLCLSPLLPKSHRFIVVKRLEKPPILFEGQPKDLHIDVKVSEFLPRTRIPSSIPETIKEFLQYVVLFSNGLAFLNVLPISAFDGTHITETLIHYFLYDYFSYSLRRSISNCIYTFTFGVAVALFVLTLYKFYAFYVVITIL